MSEETKKLRDWFAGLAMQSLIRIGAEVIKEYKDNEGRDFSDPDQPWYFGEEDYGLCAEDAYRIADAMLKERAK